MSDDLIKKIERLPQHIVYGGVILIVGLALVGTYGFFRFQEFERKKQEFIIEKQTERVEREREDTKQANLEKCLADAYSSYREYWDKEVKRVGISQKDSTLPEYYANKVNDYLKEQKDECFKKFPQK